MSVWNILKQKVRRIVCRFDAVVFAVSFAMAMLVHLYMFTHKFINHDDVDGLFSDGSFGLASGRWLLSFMTRLTGDFSSSWLGGVIGSLWLALACVLLVRIFHIRHCLPAFLLSLCAVSFPTVASTYSYMVCAPEYLFSLAFAVLGAYLISREKWYFWVSGSVAITLSMGCYQAYFALAATLLVMRLAQDILETKNVKFGAVCLRALRYVGALAAAMVTYFAVLKVLLWWTKTQMVSYQGMSSMGQLTFAELCKRIGEAYMHFGHICTNAYEVFHDWFAVASQVSLYLCGAVLIIKIIKDKLYKNPVVILPFILAGILPLACGLVFIMSGAETVHWVMMYPSLLPFIVPAILLDRWQFSPTEHKLWQIGKGIVFAALLILQVLFAAEFVGITNRAYFAMDLTEKNAYAYSVKLTARIEAHPDFDKETPIALIGRKKMESVVGGIHLTGVLTGEDAVNYYSYADYLHYELGSEYTYAFKKQIKKIKKTEEFSEMPCYPLKDSIRLIDGVLVVKFSE